MEYPAASNNNYLRDGGIWVRATINEVLIIITYFYMRMKKNGRSVLTVVTAAHSEVFTSLNTNYPQGGNWPGMKTTFLLTPLIPVLHYQTGYSSMPATCRSKRYSWQTGPRMGND